MSAGTDYERLRQLALDCEAEDGLCLACDQWKNHEMLELARGVLALLGELVAVREERDAALRDLATWRDSSQVRYERAEAAERERDTLREAHDQAVELALWIAAIDAVPIERRVEWVATLTKRYAEVREMRESYLRAATAGMAQPCHQDPDPAAVVDTPQGEA